MDLLKEIERLYLEGYGYGSIALKLGIGAKVVEKHIKSRGMNRTWAEALEMKKRRKK